MKTTTTITIDSELLAEARIRGINISGTLNDYLRSFLEVKKEEDVFDDYSAEIVQAEAKLQDLRIKQKIADDEKKKAEKEKHRISNLTLTEKIKEGVPIKL